MRNYFCENGKVKRIASSLKIGDEKIQKANKYITDKNK